MKNIKKSIVFMLGVFASIFFVSTLKANNYPLPNPIIVKKMESDATKIGIKIKFTFGRGEECTRRGLCSIEISIGSIKSGGTGTGIGTGFFKGGRFIVDFEKKSMDVQTLKTHFQDNNFVVEEDFTLTAEQAKAWGVGEYTIPAGNYPAEDLGGLLRVKF